MTEIQKILLDIFREVDKVCRANDITYYMGCGTMLGAVRHKGFIPWDDDIDLHFPRPDYERFLTVAPSALSENFKLLNFVENENISGCYAKVEDMRYRISHEWTEHTKQPTHVNIDIFPVDGVANKSIIRKLHDKYYNFLKGLANYLFQNAENRPFAKKVIAKTLQCLLPLKRVKFLEYMDKLHQRYAFDKSKYVSRPLGSCGINNIVLRQVYGKPTEYIFENQVFFGVEKCDDYLRTLYGDYMKLPPENKRVSHGYVLQS